MNEYDLTSRYRRADLTCARLHDRLNGTREYENALLPPTSEMHDDLARELAAVRAEVEALKAPEAAYKLMKNHFSDFLDAEALSISNYFSKPSRAVSDLSWRLEQLAGTDSRGDEEKSALLLRQYGGMADFLAGVRDCAGRADASERAALAAICAETRENLRHYGENVAHYFPSLTPSAQKSVSEAILSAAGQLSAFADTSCAASSPADDESRRVPFTEEYYRHVLHDTLGVELDELLSWYREEIEHTRAEVFEIASRLPIANPPRSMAAVSQTLSQYAGPCDTPEEMFARTRDYLNRAREAAKEFVWFPEERCKLERVPYPLRDSFPWGGYADGDGRQRPITGKAFLNHGNFRAISDGWLKMQAVHEAYPGHHIQYVRNVTDSLPETFKLGARHIPLIEGVAHRSERLFDFVFDEDPFYPLFVAFRRHHTAVRIKSDLMLRYEGEPIAKCVKLYMDELGFDPVTARGQVRAQESMEGYFTCYYYGMKKISDFERTYGKDACSFTELLFSCGNVSMDTLEGFLKLDPAQRRLYLTGFGSLLMDQDEAARFLKQRGI